MAKKNTGSKKKTNKKISTRDIDRKRMKEKSKEGSFYAAPGSAYGGPRKKVKTVKGAGGYIGKKKGATSKVKYKGSKVKRRKRR